MYKWDMRLGCISDSLYLDCEIGVYKIRIFGFYRFYIDSPIRYETVFSMIIVTKDPITQRNKMIVSKYFYYDVTKPLFTAIREFVNSDDFHNTIKECENYYNIKISS